MVTVGLPGLPRTRARGLVWAAIRRFFLACLLEFCVALPGAVCCGEHKGCGCLSASTRILVFPPTDQTIHCFTRHGSTHSFWPLESPVCSTFHCYFLCNFIRYYASLSFLRISILSWHGLVTDFLHPSAFFRVNMTLPLSLSLLEQVSCLASLHHSSAHFSFLTLSSYSSSVPVDYSIIHGPYPPIQPLEGTKNFVGYQEATDSSIICHETDTLSIGSVSWHSLKESVAFNLASAS